MRHRRARGRNAWRGQVTRPGCHDVTPREANSPSAEPRAFHCSRRRVGSLPGLLHAPRPADVRCLRPGHVETTRRPGGHRQRPCSWLAPHPRHPTPPKEWTSPSSPASSATPASPPPPATSTTSPPEQSSKPCAVEAGRERRRTLLRCCFVRYNMWTTASRHRPPARSRGRVAGVFRSPRRHPRRPQGLPNRRHYPGLGSIGPSCRSRPPSRRLIRRINSALGPFLSPRCSANSQQYSCDGEQHSRHNEESPMRECRNRAPPDRRPRRARQRRSLEASSRSLRPRNRRDSHGQSP